MAESPLESTDTIPEWICKDFEKASRLEWLQTNHTGAFAMGTVCGVNTRRYHGLLIATLNPPSDRYSVVPRVEETVEYSGQQIALATVQYPGIVSPAGYELLIDFSPSPFPTWRFRHEDLLVTKSVRLLEAEQSVCISYLANSSCQIHIRLFVSFRDYHSLMHQNSSLDPGISDESGHLSLKPYKDLPALHFYYEATSFEPDGVWFNNHEYARELERGLDFREDLYSPGILHFDLSPDKPVYLFATIEDRVPVITNASSVFTNPVSQALDQFRVSRADGKPTLIAGYPWFTDWSRDTLISLAAFLTSGSNAAEMKAILEFLLSERKQGILPNRFSDRQSTPEYNTVDASLWFFIAAHKYVTYTNDLAFIEQTLLPAAIDMIDWHKRGTFYGIHVDPADHLLAAGEAGSQLTWMDAKIGDFVVTPRLGKPVEINALWFNALQISSGWASSIGNSQMAQQLLNEATAVKQSFAEKFWNSDRGCLYDVLTPLGTDASLRPNQLFALSLPFPLLDRERARSIVQLVQEHLLTAVGVRTLEPSDPRYCPRYGGDMHARDSAYHQGTVWPWLIGPFVEAYLYAFHNSVEAKRECNRLTDSIRSLMTSYCLGSIAEVYDGDPPHNAGGCPAQLWSVAQIALALQRIQEV